MVRECSMALMVILAPVVVPAQSLGIFRWQQQPYCNVLTLAVTQNGGVYELEGTDDQCGAGTAASAIGTAFFNPDGSIGFGLAIVTTPGGAAVHVEASISLSTLGGTWRDSAGGSGAFVFTPGVGAGGSPRPAAGSGIPPGSVGSAQVNASQVQLRVDGSCASGSFMQSVGQTGAISCGSEVGDITSVSAGLGLFGGGAAGAVALSLQTTPSGAFLLFNDNGLVASGIFGSGSIPAAGPGTRAMWYPRKAAFRAGTVFGEQWDDANVGIQSVAFGLGTKASGPNSTAIGEGSVASGINSTAAGLSSVASGGTAIAIGTRALAGGNGSVALGSDVSASTNGTFMFGDRSTTTPMLTFAPNEFLVRAAGGTGIYSNASLTSGVELAPGGGSWSSVSDANMKENFRDLEANDMLAKIARMPIREWNYKSQASAIRHVGPTAQDFHAAFGLGEDPLRISTIDADGIALRAIQALEARTRDLQETNDALRADVAALREQLARLDAQRR